MPNSMLVFIFSVLDGKHPFWVNYFDLPKVSKISSLRQSALKSIYLKSKHSTVPETRSYKKEIFSLYYKNDKPIIKRFKPVT